MTTFTACQRKVYKAKTPGKIQEKDQEKDGTTRNRVRKEN